MAYKINSLIKESLKKDIKDDKFLVIAGNGHLLHYCGVPERVLKENSHLKSETCLIISESASPSSFEGNDNNEVAKSFLKSRFGIEGSNPADYVYYYETPL